MPKEASHHASAYVLISKFVYSLGLNQFMHFLCHFLLVCIDVTMQILLLMRYVIYNVPICRI